MVSLTKIFIQDAIGAIHISRASTLCQAMCTENRGKGASKAQGHILIRAFIFDYEDLWHHQSIMVHHVKVTAAKMATKGQSINIELL